MEIIHKDAGDLKLAPNSPTTNRPARRSVGPRCRSCAPAWAGAATSPMPRWTGTPPAEAGRTAMRFIADAPGSAELVSHDVSYAELGRLTRKFTNVLRGLGIGRATGCS